ncbi:hypothetical protein V8G54_024017 [Vigna mungo]|uniref:Uncharacterized protein n=1 Tax=Vigna mungo TaxID=3915 RepID=A0AAQ3RT33_VIGMU
MGIDDEIRAHASISRKWHINIWPQLRANTFLSMSTAKFIPNNRVPRMSKAYVNLLKMLRVFDIHSNIININSFRTLSFKGACGTCNFIINATIGFIWLYHLTNMWKSI